LEEKIKQLQQSFPNLVFEKKDSILHLPTGETKTIIFYLVNGLRGNEELLLVVRKEEDLDNIAELLEKKVLVFKDFLAIHYDDKVEVLLSSIRPSPAIFSWDRELERLIEAKIHYYRNEVTASITNGSTGALLPLLVKHIRRARTFHPRRSPILTLSNLTKPTSDGIIADTRNILNSLLFDIEYSYDIAFETVNAANFIRKHPDVRRVRNEIPSDVINFVYKKYIPELIEYFHIGLKVDYLPFKYICYFHIIEYFSDRSAYKLVAQQIRNLILKPDFHIKTT